MEEIEEIDSIEELDEEKAYQANYTMPSWTDKEKVIVKQQNKILRAVKQINRKLED